MYLEALDIYCTDHKANPFGIQWMRLGKKYTLPGSVKNLSHFL